MVRPLWQSVQLLVLAIVLGAIVLAGRPDFDIIMETEVSFDLDEGGAPSETKHLPAAGLGVHLASFQTLSADSSRFRPAPIFRARRESFGSAVEVPFGREVLAQILCELSAVDENGGYWDWAWEARLYDPSNTVIGSASNGVVNKPGAYSTVVANVSDPPVGSYRCEIDWYVNETYLGQSQNTKTLSYPVPTGESTSGSGEGTGWSSTYPTVYKWMQTLSAGTFKGRNVSEHDGGNGDDTCWFSGSAIGKWESITGGSWPVDTNNRWGADYVGWLPTAVSYYRAQGRAPCMTEFDQDMKINRPGTTEYKYRTNRLKAGFTSGSVWSERDGLAQSKSY